MDEGLKRALAGEYEERDFHGAKVRIKHLSANARLDMVERYSSEIDGEKAVGFYLEIITRTVEGVTEDDAATLREASWPRFEELAQLALSVNKMGGRDVEGLAGN
jgi:hypothetical protein